jgi:Transposase DDE domain group 1
MRPTIRSMAAIVRADSGFAREAIMTWCEENHVFYCLGLARNDRLVELLKTNFKALRAQIKEGKVETPCRSFTEFEYLHVNLASRSSVHRATSGLAGRIFPASSLLTFGLLAVILGCARLRSIAVPLLRTSPGPTCLTASTSFANPAITLARSASDTFARIRPADAPGFILAQLAGAASAPFSLAGAFASQIHCFRGRFPSFTNGGNL